jgi:hypothetical protein
MGLSIAAALAAASCALTDDYRGIAAMELRSESFLRGFADCPGFPTTSYNGTGPFNGISVGTGGCDLCTAYVSAGSGGAVSPAGPNTWRLSVTGGGTYAPQAVARIRLRNPSGGPMQLWSGAGQGDPFDWNSVSFRLVDNSWGAGVWDAWEYEAKGLPLPVPAGADFEAVLTSDGQPDYIDYNWAYHFTLESAGGSQAPTVISAEVIGSWDYSGPSAAYQPFQQVSGGVPLDQLDCAGEYQLKDEYTAWAEYLCPLTNSPATGASAGLLLRADRVDSCDWMDIATIARATLTITEPVQVLGASMGGGTLRLDGAVLHASSFPLMLAVGQRVFEWTVGGGEASALLHLRAFDTAFALQSCLGGGETNACRILESDAPDIDRNWLPDDCQRAMGDLTLNGIVDSGDLAMVLSAWNTIDPDADLNDDGIVAASDIMELLNRWGPLE